MVEVDSDARTIDLVKRNVAHARLQGGHDCCDVMRLDRSGPVPSLGTNIDMWGFPINGWFIIENSIEIG